MGDIASSDCESPRKARKCFNIAKSTVELQKKKIKSLQRSKQRLRRRVLSLKSLTKMLKEKFHLSENAEKTIEVSINNSYLISLT